ncbi:MAG: PP2C family protein-serine/threonine phosphatase [Bacteroidota bacterium]
MIDPLKFRRLLVKILTWLAVYELISAFVQGSTGNGWNRFGIDLVIAGILYITWENIVRNLEERKESYRKRLETSPQQIGLREALMFSLLASDEIYLRIPEDRHRLVVISYTLIALGLVAAFLKIGVGFMPLVVSGALLLGGVNLLVWIVSLERGEKESLQTELKLAHDVQMSLMPREQPSLASYDIAGFSLPAREVGGDSYDYSILGQSGNRFGVAVLDVSGKGIQAAMSAVFTTGAYASEARLSSSPAEILTHLNKAVYQHSKRGHFVAFILAALDQESGRVVFANAGQTRPILVSQGKAATLCSSGVHFPLGMQEDTLFDEREIQLAPGDSLLFLTDGFTDAMNAEKEQFGVERIERLLSLPSSQSATAKQVIEALLEDIRLFTGSAPQHDDMTAVMVKRDID